MSPVVILLFAIAAMGLGAVVMVLFPLLRRARKAAPRTDFDEAVYRDQLAEIDRDRDRGIIGKTEAEAARAEIARRLILVSRDTPADTDARDGPVSVRLRVSVAALGVALPVMAVLFYLFVGSPTQPGLPFAERSKNGGGEEMTLEKFTKIIAMVERGVQLKPDEIAGWKILSTGLLRLGRDGDAEKALARAIALAGGDRKEASRIATNFGEALVAREGGQVAPRARAAFERAHGFDPKAAAPRYYLGLALLQGGDRKGALALWDRLAAEAPKDAPWLGILQKRIERLKREREIRP